MKQQSKMILKERRLLSKAEKKYINEKMAKRSVKGLVICYVIFLLLISALAALFIFLGGIKEGIVCFTLLHLLFVMIMVYISKSVDKLLETINSGDVYVREAIFLDSNIYHHSTFEVMNKGRKELYFRKVTPDNEVKAGDKVVLIEIGKTLWVYKVQADKP